MTDNQTRVLDYLRRHPSQYIGPNQIGHDIGGVTAGGLQRHSAWASPICQSLVALGLVERNERGRYRAVSLVPACCPGCTHDPGAPISPATTGCYVFVRRPVGRVCGWRWEGEG